MCVGLIVEGDINWVEIVGQETVSQYHPLFFAAIVFDRVRINDHNHTDNYLVVLQNHVRDQRHQVECFVFVSVQFGDHHQQVGPSEYGTGFAKNCGLIFLFPKLVFQFGNSKRRSHTILRFSCGISVRYSQCRSDGIASLSEVSSRLGHRPRTERRGVHRQLRSIRFAAGSPGSLFERKPASCRRSLFWQRKTFRCYGNWFPHRRRTCNRSN